MARLRPELKNMKNEYKVDLARSPDGGSTGQERKPRQKGENRSDGLAKPPKRISNFLPRVPTRVLV